MGEKSRVGAAFRKLSASAAQAWALWLAVAVPGLRGAEPLRSLAEIREMTTAEARSGRTVEVEAVVTFSKPSEGTLFVCDGEAGIFVERGKTKDKDAGPRAGDRVKVRGVSGEGLFAPVVTGPGGVAEVEVLGNGELPEAEVVEGPELARPEMDSGWVSVEAVVREVTMVDGDVVLECEAGGVKFNVLSEGPVRLESVPWNLAETRVRVRGVVATSFNAERQMTGRFLRVNSLADVERLDPGGAGGEAPRLVRAADLFRYGGPGADEVVCLRGMTTMVMPGRGVFLRTDDGGIWVQTAQPVAAAPGTALEVEGWPRAGAVKPFLRARKAKVLAVGAPPEPVVVDARGALRSTHEAELVSVAAELLGGLAGADGLTLELRDAGMVFRGVLPEAADKLPAAALVPGSRLRVTGIAHITPAGRLGMQADDKLVLHLRSPEDVVVVAPPPFWTVRHVLVGAAVVIAVMLGWYGVARGRRQREQESQRREFEAVLAERGRFAREIHDSLAQGLTSISLQLEYVRDCVASDPEDAAAHIETARGLVRDSLREARRTVWNLRPLALGEADLATAFRRLAGGLAGEGRTVRCDDIEGTPRPLPPDHEATLLRIGQEALTNAAKHSGASEIRLRLRFGPGWVTLTVKDNGKGFDVASKVGKGYGLTGMHERVAGLGGSLSIDSSPGQGTEVSATFPD